MVESTPSPSIPDDVRVAVPDELTLEENLPFVEIQRRVALSRVGSGLRHRADAFYLRSIERRRLHLAVGCRTVSQCAAVHLGISRREARDLLRVGRALEELPAIDDALATKKLCWSKVREIVKAARPETEANWIEITRGLSIDETILAVRLAEGDGQPRTPDERKGLPEPRLRIEVDVPPDVYAMWEKAREKLEDQTKGPVRDWECLHAALELLLSVKEDGSVPGKERTEDSRYTVVASATSGCTCECGGRHEVDTEDGLLAISPATAELMACDGGRHDPEDPSRSRELPRRLRRAILARDRHRCQCCGCRHGLQVHHVWPWSEGGPSEAWNLLTVCRMCHALIHGSLIVVRFVEENGRKVGFCFEDKEGNPLHGRCARYEELLQASGESIRRLVPDLRGAAQCAAPLAAGPAPPPPVHFADIVGQRPVIASLEMAVAVARERREPLGHVLLQGGPGLGKTTVAHAIATELGVPIHRVSAPVLRTPELLTERLAPIARGDVLFIDEIHAVPQPVAEMLYESLEAGSFTLIGATTEPGSLPAPFLSRFEHREHLEPYAQDDLAEIIRRAAGREGVEIEPAAAVRLASISRGTAREALRLFRRALLEARHRGRSTIDLEVVAATCARLRIDDRGLGPVDRACVAALREFGTLALHRLAAIVGVDARTLERDHEPHLLSLGLIGITPQGRVARGRDRPVPLHRAAPRTRGAGAASTVPRVRCG